jgi:hypothetical protein
LTGKSEVLCRSGNAYLGNIWNLGFQNWIWKGFQIDGKSPGGLPVESGTLTDVDLEPKSLDFCWEI